MDAKKRPKICDFGLSRYANEKDDDFMTNNVGTAHSMAPELFNQNGYDNKVDVYAYGMLLWEMLTGHSPFKGKVAAQIAYAVCKENKRPKIPHQTPTALKELITKCWDGNPKNRPTFHHILKYFRNHSAKFPDTDDELISSFFHHIKKQGSPKFKEYEELPRELAKKSHRKKSSYASDDEDDFERGNDIEVINGRSKLPPLNSDTFQYDLEKIVQNLFTANAIDFFTSFQLYFSDDKIPSNSVSILIHSVL